MTGDRGFKPGLRQREPARLYYCRAEWDWFVGTRALGTLRQIRRGSYGRARKSTCPAWMAWGWSSRADKALVIAAVKLRSCGKVFVESHRRLADP